MAIGFCQDCLRKAGNAYEECIKFSQNVPNMPNEGICTTIRMDLYGKCPQICKGWKILQTFEVIN